MTHDAMVAGAGPAGSAAANHLARAGLDVLVLEKTSFPREKVCGDGLTPRAVRAGAALRENTGVTAPLTANGRVRGVRTSSGVHEARLVIAADVPPWTSTVRAEQRSTAL